jgi:hypothetical protein
MALGVLLMAPLPLDGEWTWDFPIGSPWLGFLIGIPVFILGLWTLTLGVRSKSKNSSEGGVWLIDEWICEEGKEEEETAECQRLLAKDEKLLELVAARGQPSLNCLAVTDKRVVIYSQGNVQSAVSYDFEQIEEIRGKRNAVLRHLGEITIVAKGNAVSLKNVGIEYVDRVVALVSKTKH